MASAKIREFEGAHAHPKLNTPLSIDELEPTLSRMQITQELDCGVFKMIWGTLDEEKILIVNGANGVSVIHK